MRKNKIITNAVILLIIISLIFSSVVIAERTKETSKTIFDSEIEVYTKCNASVEIEKDVYVPEYGWVYSEIPQGHFTYEPKKRLNLRISFPWEENDTDHYGQSERIIGMHRWFWISDDNIDYIYYNSKNNDNSMMQSRIENEVCTDSVKANETFIKTREVYYLFEYYQQIELVGDNLIYYQNAVSFQKEAIFELSESDNLDDYLGYLEKSKEEYNKIIL